MKTETYHIRVGQRSCTVKVEQSQERVLIAIRHAGEKRRRVDHLAVLEWLAPIVAKFENDDRPIEIVDLKP